MEAELSKNSLGPSSLPIGFRFVSWRDNLIREHAKAKWESFHNEIDANVFPCLGDKRGCVRLMRDISERSNFIPQATWLVVHQAHPNVPARPVGTIQGLRMDADRGAIQNVGIVPDFRSIGLGSALLYKALEGFIDVGCSKVELEVTVQNTAAIRLYERLGFRRAETVFKVAEVAMA
jgi:RimJ/RimL family protein N-acetyltransferase